MTEHIQVGRDWQSVALWGRWFLLTNENGSSGIELRVDTVTLIPEVTDKGSKLGHRKGVTLNVGVDTLFIRSTSDKICNVSITAWGDPVVIPPNALVTDAGDPITDKNLQYIYGT